jgi:hypothetical protein
LTTRQAPGAGVVVGEADAVVGKADAVVGATDAVVGEAGIVVREADDFVGEADVVLVKEVVIADVVVERVRVVVVLVQISHTTVVFSGIPSVRTRAEVGQHVPLGAVVLRLARFNANDNSGELTQPTEQSGEPMQRKGMVLPPSAVHSYKTAKLFAPGSRIKQTPLAVTIPGVT